MTTNNFLNVTTHKISLIIFILTASLLDRYYSLVVPFKEWKPL